MTYGKIVVEIDYCCLSERPTLVVTREGCSCAQCDRRDELPQLVDTACPKCGYPVLIVGEDLERCPYPNCDYQSGGGDPTPEDLDE